MKRCFSRAAFAAALLLAGACAPAVAGARPHVAQPLPDSVVSMIDSLASAAIAAGPGPGLAIAVARHGVPVYSRGFGRADTRSGNPVESGTVFRIASITKQFTAAAILRLEEESRLSLDDDIGRFIPEYATGDHGVTIRHLLNHTSGIRSYTSLGPRWAMRMAEDLSHEEMLALFQDEPADFAPGERFLYNNSGYYLLGLIIEEVTGAPYAEYIDREIARPLGLSHTLYCPNEPAAGHAHGYMPGSDGPIPAPPLSMTQPYSAGALCSTAEDLVRWSHALASGRVVSAEGYGRMTTPGTLTSGEAINYGYGLIVGALDGATRFAHGGGINGFSTFLAEFPEQGVSVAVLVNNTATNAGRLADNVSRAVLGLAVAPTLDRPMTAEDRARFVGTFDLGSLEIRVFEDGEELRAQGTGQMPIRLLWQGGAEFRAAFDPDVRIEFAVEEGRATGLTIHQGGATITAPRIR